ncbi:MAG: hypothetical protein JXJ30_02510 [Halothiobacillaceae bacterium]|nr:hypothetical protein [Halothiobacillaceae bacterium]
MDRDLVLSRVFTQPPSISGEIFYTSEAGLPVVAALDDVLRHIGQTDPGQSCHVQTSILGGVQSSEYLILP